jgi:hypothetical protein
MSPLRKQGQSDDGSTTKDHRPDAASEDHRNLLVHALSLLERSSQGGGCACRRSGPLKAGTSCTRAHPVRRGAGVTVLIVRTSGGERTHARGELGRGGGLDDHGLPFCQAADAGGAAEEAQARDRPGDPRPGARADQAADAGEEDHRRDPQGRCAEPAGELLRREFSASPGARLPAWERSAIPWPRLTRARSACFSSHRPRPRSWRRTWCGHGDISRSSTR